MSELQRWQREKTGVRIRVREMKELVRVLASGRRDQVEAIYDMLSTHNNLGRRTLYLNMGYWKNATTYDDACEALATLLGERAELKPGLKVADCGFGFGDQDLLWARTTGVNIVGFNITSSQVKVARERVEAAGLSDRVDLRCRSATDTGLPDASVDRVTALESAFHFPSRDDFFREAHRILKPGGRIALADLTTAPTPPRGLPDRLAHFMIVAGCQIPDCNLYDTREYVRRLQKAGFDDVKFERINEHVFGPYGVYSRKRQSEPEVAARSNLLIRALWRAEPNDRVFDFIVVTGVRR
jgi:cyclopropane fatty-acyl-phospholipid synthase-like methyltransferase